MKNIYKLISKYQKSSYAVSMIVCMFFVLYFTIPEYFALKTGVFQLHSGKYVSLDENPTSYYFIVIKQGLYSVISLILLLAGIFGGIKKFRI